MNKILQLYLDNAKREKQLVNAVRNGTDASIYIYDVIDAYWGVSALSVIAAVNAAAGADTLHVYINSPGGDVFEGRAIMAVLSRFTGKTVAHIDSLCASAATSIALSCDTVEMSAGAFFMIHNASTIAWGDKTDLRDTANLLEKIEGSIIADYMTKTGKTQAEIVDWMNAETWFDSTEALSNGFIDKITEAPVAAATDKPANTWNLSVYAKAPAALVNNGGKPNPAAPTKPTARGARAVKNAVTATDAEVSFMKAVAPHYNAVVDIAKAALPSFETDSIIELTECMISDHAGDLELMEVWAGDLDNDDETTEGAPAPVEPDVAPVNSMAQSNKNRLALLQAL